MISDRLEISYGSEPESVVLEVYRGEDRILTMNFDVTAASSLAMKIQDVVAGIVIERNQ